MGAMGWKKKMRWIAAVFPVIGLAGLNQLVLYLLHSSRSASLWSLAITGCLASWAIFLYISSERRRTGGPVMPDSLYGGSVLQLNEEMEQTDKLSLAGTLAAGIAHEIRNPLTSLRGFLQLLKDKDPHYTAIMLSEVDRINGIVNELLELASPKAFRMQPQLLQPMLQNVILLLQPQAVLCNIQIIGNFSQEAGSLVINSSENKLKQVFINLIKNAIEAMPGGGNIIVSVASDKEWALVEIEDEGPGIPQEHVGRIGSQFYTTKMQGTGLGLMVSRRIIEDHNGILSFRNSLKGGAVVTVKLPVLRETGGL